MTIDNEPLFKLKPRVLDTVVGKIFLPSQISVFHSEERFPLTALAHSIVVAACHAGGESIYLDSGSNFSPQMIRSMTNDPEESLRRIKVGSPLGLEEFELFLESLKSTTSVSLVVIDSLTGFMNLSTSPGSKERQRHLYRTLEVLREVVNASRVHLLITDFSSRNWKTGQHRPLGGNVIEHAVDSVVSVNAIDGRLETVRINVDRTPVLPNPGGVILKINHRGIRSIKSD